MGRILVLQICILVLFLKVEAQGTVNTIYITSFGRPTATDVSVCVNEIPENTAHFILLPKGDSPFSAAAPFDNLCIPFMWNIAANPGDIHFVLNALDAKNDPLGTGTEDVTVPEFPSLSSTILQTKFPMGSDKVLRVKGDKKTFTYTVDGATVTANNGLPLDNIEYHIGPLSATEVTPCAVATVPVCDIPFPDNTITLKNKINVENAILKYKDDLKEAEITIDITGESVTPTALDIIINLSPGVLCLGSDITDQTCTIPWTPGEQEVDIRLVQTSDGELYDYKEHKIKDCELLAGGIDDTTLEVRWLQFGTKIYHLTVMDELDASTGDTLEVNCNDLTLDHCFAYFTLQSPGPYSVKVQEMDTGTPKTVNKVQSKLYTLPTLAGLTTIHIDAEAHQNGSEAQTTVCFHHTSQEIVEKTFSHYEFVIINYKGQWLKHKLMTHETHGHFCFTPFNVYTNDFDTSKGAKIIVTQRAEDGFTVLASGKTHITFNENL